MQKTDEVFQICTEEFLVPFEGTGPMTADKKFFIAYPDPATKAEPITIAWGLTFDEFGNKIKLGDMWDYEKALRTKKLVLATFLSTLFKMSPKLVLENPRRIAAVLSWCYNLGFGNYRVSTFKKRIDSQDWDGAAEECKKWDKAAGRVMRGLTRRRKAESLGILNPEVQVVQK